jgi:hypothetical protein
MPKLVCDMPPDAEQVKYYTIAGLPGNPTTPKLATGPYGFEYDLASLLPGTYSIRCSACNDWACSLPSPLDFTVPEKATAPLNLRLAV